MGITPAGCVQVMQGLCHLVLSRPAEAEQCLRSALQQGTESVQLPKPATLLLTLALQDQGKLAEAEEVWPCAPHVLCQ